MDVYGVTGMDDLLDLSSDEIFASSTATPTTHSDLHCHASSTAVAATATGCFDAPTADYYNFPDVFCVHSDDAAELEWLSNYMDDSITDCPANSITSAAAAFHGSSRRRNGAAAGTYTWSSTSPPNDNVNQRESSITSGYENAEKERRCTHCSSEKTPQWRTGPMGPKTLCNACGVRTKVPPHKDGHCLNFGPSQKRESQPGPTTANPKPPVAPAFHRSKRHHHKRDQTSQTLPPPKPPPPRNTTQPTPINTPPQQTHNRPRTQKENTTTKPSTDRNRRGKNLHRPKSGREKTPPPRRGERTRTPRSLEETERVAQGH
ncbi:unnamed protein product [Fraxinus pennsylvanica]|uniref:GATA-type domain-containing protein n=1 Tax=Fraxinus pennsylvanica TaxID=56036 RepID=A0AAD2A547_9LAMI|nr:unnamed protein product [Fraxinus pennsylvanica]